MKNEFLKGMRFHSIEEVETAVAKAVKFYNEERPHMSINMMPPREAALHVGELTKKWTSLREKHIKEQMGICKNSEEDLPSHPCVGLTVGRSPEGNPTQG